MRTRTSHPQHTHSGARDGSTTPLRAWQAGRRAPTPSRTSPYLPISPHISPYHQRGFDRHTARTGDTKWQRSCACPSMSGARYGEIWGGVGRYGERLGDMGRYGVYYRCPPPRTPSTTTPSASRFRARCCPPAGSARRRRPCCTRTPAFIVAHSRSSSSSSDFVGAVDAAHAPGLSSACLPSQRLAVLEAEYLPISPHISPYLPISPHISTYLHISPHISTYLYISPHISPYLPISPHISPYLHISPHISPYLHISPHISTYLRRDLEAPHT